MWPHDGTDWREMLDRINQTYITLTKVISRYQRVIIVAYNNAHKNSLARLCNAQSCDMSRLTFLTIKTNDTWVRDYGPQFLIGTDACQYLDFEFNAWGEQFSSRLDDLFAGTLFECISPCRCHYQRIPYVIEGGNLEFDSHANLLTNIACIKRNNRQSSLDTDSIIELLKNRLSLQQVHAINVPPLQGDDTGGHIDTLARFINDYTIVYNHTQDKSNPNYDILALLREQLGNLTNPQGMPYHLIPVSLPENVRCNEKRHHLPASYVNFIFVNNAIIVPLYDDRNDQFAIQTLQQACPEREVLGINANNLLEQYGSLHCATLHIPENVLNESWLNTT